jgi:shikimate dehydrogenase
VNNINGETRVVAILGDPIAQARSPELFNALFAKNNVNAILLPLHVPAPALGCVLNGLSMIHNVAGVVITVPHKVPAMAFAETCSADALNTGAVNCLRRCKYGKWAGAMFDGLGFVRGLQAQHRPIIGMRVLLVGAGGAGAAVAHALADAGAESIDIFDSNVESAKRLVDALNARHAYTAVALSTAVATSQHDLVINATPCGMRTEDPIPIDLAAASPQATIADLVMTPASTRLLIEATARGLATHPGRHLLEHSVEAIAGFLNLLQA